MQYSLNLVFSLEWQQEIKKKLSEKIFDEIYVKKFGNSDYEKLKEIKEWIYSRKNPSDYIGFIYDKDSHDL